MEKAEGKLELITQYFAEFTEVQLGQLAALDGLYREWNERINVVSRKDIDGLYEKHILHSLSIAASFAIPAGYEVIDIGTGGGFPGIPLAIFFPDAKFHLVDSIGKKIKVVDAVTAAIGLQNITTAHTRAEEIKNRKFDLAVSRAVAPLRDLLTWTKPLLRKNVKRETPVQESVIPHGLVCLKGGDLATEISESGARPRMVDIHDVFPLDYFKEKYILYVPN